MPALPEFTLKSWTNRRGIGQHGLRSPRPYPWYLVESWVAAQFMAYLATVLASQPSVDAAPITFDANSLRALKDAGPCGISDARTVLLEHVFPRPKGVIKLDDLVQF